MRKSEIIEKLGDRVMESKSSSNFLTAFIFKFVSIQTKVLDVALEKKYFNFRLDFFYCVVI